MTEGEYVAELKKLGMTAYSPSYQGATVYVDRNGDTHSIPDAAELSPEKRQAFIDLLKFILGDE